MFQGLVASDAPELRPVLLHLVGEGALGPTERLGNGAVGDFVVVHPHSDDGVRIGVKLPQTGEETVEQVAVGDDALDGRGLIRNHVQQGTLAVLADGNVQRSHVAGTTVLTDEAVSVTDPDFTLRADALPVGLRLHADAGSLVVVDVADFLGDRNLLSSGANVDERLVFIKSTPLDGIQQSRFALSIRVATQNGQTDAVREYSILLAIKQL